MSKTPTAVGSNFEPTMIDAIEIALSDARQAAGIRFGDTQWELFCKAVTRTLSRKLKEFRAMSDEIQVPAPTMGDSTAIRLQHAILAELRKMNAQLSAVKSNAGRGANVKELR